MVQLELQQPGGLLCPEWKRDVVTLRSQPQPADGRLGAHPGTVLPVVGLADGTQTSGDFSQRLCRQLPRGQRVPGGESLPAVTTQQSFCLAY